MQTTNPTMTITLRPEAAWSHLGRLYEEQNADGFRSHIDKPGALIKVTESTRRFTVMEMTQAAVAEMIEDFMFLGEHRWEDAVRKQVAWQR